jgi:hypothetical protein
MGCGLYMDVHVPAAITGGLRGRGVDVLTSQEDGTRRSEDEQLLIRTTELQRILFTQDGDLLRIAADWQQKGLEFSGVVFAFQEDSAPGPIIEDLELVAECGLPDEFVNRVLYLPCGKCCRSRQNTIVIKSAIVDCSNS